MSAVVFFTGNAGRDPESQYTPNGAMVTKFSVAVSNGYGERKTTTWFNCEGWGEKLGELINSFIGKGTKVVISGELNIREWKTKEGEPRTSNDVKIHTWEVVGKRKAQEEGAEESPFDDGGEEE